MTLTKGNFLSILPSVRYDRAQKTPANIPTNHITFALEVFNPRFKGNTVTDRDSSLKHISATLARRPNKCITLSRTNLSNTGNSLRVKLTPGSHVGSPCNFKRVYMRRQRAKGGRGAGFGVGGGGGT